MTALDRRGRAALVAVFLGLASLAPARAVSAQAQAASAAEQAAIKLQQAGDWTGAFGAFEALSRAEPSNPRAAFGLGASLHETGRPGEAVPALIRARDLGYQPANQVRFRLARAYAKLGDKAKAIAQLEEAAANGFTNAPLFQNPDFDSLRADASFAAVVAKVNHNARPCEADPNFRKFDFWVGDWDVQQTGIPRAPVGASSHVERILSGCVIFENWEPGQGGAGKSFNTYNTATKKWEQYWVDATGRITHYFGEFHDDGNLYYEADQFGTANKVRMTFFNEGPDRVRQLGHLSQDGGKTWSVSFDLTYLRKK
ncbi:MAG: tetratricopeptide repeat protein [Vicinamibacteria bacterium]|nr:tetratricopeptide repeat protein [Vicinamibacteria bacterium]